MGLSTKIAMSIIVVSAIVSAALLSVVAVPPEKQTTRVESFGNPPPAIGVEESKPEVQHAFQFKDDSTVTHEVLAINRQGEDLIDIVFYDSKGDPAVRIKADGSVELFREPEQAALAFWQAVATSMPLCRKGLKQ